MNHREDPTFSPEYTDDYFVDKPNAPFPVCVIGIEGIVDGPDSLMGVQDIEDGNHYTLLGLDCFWTYPPQEEIVEAIAQGTAVISSVRRYIDAQNALYEISEAADRAWLGETNIDPESL